MKKILSVFLIALFAAACTPKGVLRYAPYRWMADEDKRPIEKPKVRKNYSEYSDADTESGYLYTGAATAMQVSEKIGLASEKISYSGRLEALDLDNFGEVPDSTWFTNRLGRFEMSAKEAAENFDPQLAPDVSSDLEVLRGDVFSGNPRLYIKDARGRKYVIKFDPPELPGIATGAELIASIILRNAGYNVYDNYIIELDPNRLQLTDKSITTGKYGKKIALTGARLSEIMRSAGVRKNGKVRAVATLYPKARPLGPFKFSSKVFDDKNDRIPHQHRRELRGYRVFSSFINNPVNTDGSTLDLFIETDGALGYVRHGFFDLSTALGNPRALAADMHLDPTELEKLRSDYNYGIGSAAAAILTFGIYKPPVQAAEKCDDTFNDLPFLPSCQFNPGKWRASQSNPASYFMTDTDAYWAARIITRLSDDAIRRIVRLARFPEKRFETYVARQLIERRDAIGHYWFSAVNPLDDFVVSAVADGAKISFDDLAVTNGFAKDIERRYRYMLRSRYSKIVAVPWTYADESEILLGSIVLAGLPAGMVYELQIETYQDGYEWPLPIINVYIEKGPDGTLKILGLKRK